jgi:hypothetical protein
MQNVMQAAHWHTIEKFEEFVSAAGAAMQCLRSGNSKKKSVNQVINKVRLAQEEPKEEDNMALQQEQAQQNPILLASMLLLDIAVQTGTLGIFVLLLLSSLTRMQLSKNTC